jgi:uncharacterized protein (TIGR02145 family)/prepilin-type N-terminal cleavage/methylation domain-containing protein
MRKTKRKAFTLIELLVVVAIVGVLSSLAIVSLQRSRSSARDTKRVSDVRQIFSALDLFIYENGRYPTEEEFYATPGKLVSPTSGQIFLNEMPVAPTPVDGECTPEENTYKYEVNDIGDEYQISFCTGSKVSGFGPGVLCMTPGGVSVCPPDACNDQTSISYGGEEYDIVVIEDQCWMAENLKYDNGCSSVAWLADSDEGWCGYYNNDEATYGDYGMLYQWSAAMNGTTTEGAQGICPEGWHLPTDAEWTTLIDWVEASGYSGMEGPALRATDSNDPPWDGTDDFGFAALPAGTRHTDGGFNNFGSSTNFWSSSENSVGNAWFRYLSSGYPGVYRSYANSANGFIVRCIRD